MENPFAIQVHDVSMRFNLASEKVDSFKEFCVKKLKGQIRTDEFYALKHIELEIRKGEAFAIVGENGCGKSTLLKVISGIYYPSHGSVQVEGSIAPLIELGAGFDMDLTARENIFLNGSVLGYSREFMDIHFEEIIDFAELWDFVDVPVKNFSSGMMARLAFSIATMVTPDVLIVDEILAVGDFMFQQKCEDKIRKMLDAGTTLLFVSHSTEQVKHLCQRAVWITHGEIRKIGSAEEVCDAYVAGLSEDKAPMVEGTKVLPAEEPPARETPREPRPAGPHYVFLDVLKTLALLLIIYDHTAPFNLRGMGYTWMPMDWITKYVVQPFGITENFGYFGVCIFFMVSGFAICKNQLHYGRWNYLRSRLLRIFPPLILATLFLYVFQLLIATVTGQPTYWAQFSPLDWVKSALLLSYVDVQKDLIFGITWWLVPLVLFYLWSWLFLPVVKKTIPLYVTLMLCVVGITPILVRFVPIQAQNMLRLQSYLGMILLGQVLYWAYTKELSYKRAAVFFGIDLLFCFWNIYVFYPESFNEGGPLRCVNFLYALGLFVMLMGLNKYLKETKLTTFFSKRTMAFYLCHLQISQLLLPILIPQIGVTLTMAVTYGAIIVSTMFQYKAIKILGF